MTENEALIALRNRIETYSQTYGRKYAEMHLDDLKEAITALKEIQQYREIGTVEECRGAVEKQKPQKPKLNYKPRFLGKATYTCPKCGNCCLEEFANERQNNNYCWDCGQAIRWDENLEGMRDERERDL